jgi:hypothetical protein
MERVEHNMNTISFSPEIANKVQKVMNNYYEPQTARWSKIIKLAKPTNQHISEDKYLKRFILNEHKSKIPMEE